MQKLTNEEIKKRIKELQNQKSEIASEIYKLREMNKGYWIGIISGEYDNDYHRLGFCTETEAEDQMKNIAEEVINYYGYEIKEVTEEYNSKMYLAEKLQNAINLLSNDKEFAKYKDFVKEIKKDLMQLKEDLNIPDYAHIF